MVLVAIPGSLILTGEQTFCTDPKELPNDLACGTGDFSRLALDRFPRTRMVAVDLAELMLRRARPQCHLWRRLSSSVRRRMLRLRLHRLWPAQFSASRGGGSRSGARDSPWRAVCYSGFLSPCKSPTEVPLSWISLRHGRLLGRPLARPPAHLHIHSRFASQRRFCWGAFHGSCSRQVMRASKRAHSSLARLVCRGH
jgi:hypothetical protein